MHISLPRNRVLLLATVVEQFSKRFLTGSLKDALVEVGAELNQMIADHDNKSKV